MASPLLVVVLCALAAALAVSVRRLRVTDRDVAWLHGSVAPAPAAAVYRRYLARHRTHRLVGAWFGIALAVVYGISARAGVVVGVGAGGPLGDVLFCGLAGVLVGALSAETFRLSEPRHDRALASLSARPGPAAGRTVAAARALAACAVVVGLVGLLGVQASPVGTAVAVGGAAVVALGEATRAAVANRRRPVLSPLALEVDARVRGYAWGAAAHLELAAASLTLAWTVSSVPALAGVLPGAGPAVTVVVLALVVLTVVELRRARPRPPRDFAVLPHAGLRSVVA